MFKLYQCFTLMNVTAIFIFLHKPTLVSTASLNNLFVYLDARYWENYIPTENAHTHTHTQRHTQTHIFFLKNHVRFNFFFFFSTDLFIKWTAILWCLCLSAVKWRCSVWVEVQSQEICCFDQFAPLPRASPFPCPRLWVSSKV